MTTTWVVGAGGLLGSAVVRVLRGAGVEPVQAAIRWTTPNEVTELRAGLSALIDRAAGGDWRILWCAGSGTTSTTRAHLDAELATFRAVLDAIAALPAETRARGLLSYASSAGGVYGGAGHGPFTESSEPRPLGDYGAAKLAAEKVALDVSAEAGIRVLIARIANLYGPGQNLDKPQGLISRLAVSTVSRVPISVFVPLDTLRDYLYVDDAARMLVASAERAHTSTELAHLKLLCSGRAVTIAAVLAEFRRVSGTRPLVVTGASTAAGLQGRDLRLHSMVWDDLDSHASTTLAAGIDRTLADVRRSWLAGRLVEDSA